MNWLTNLIVVVQLLAGLGIVGLVLVQHGKGADMGASFGSGASGSLFGATGSANFLSRSTAVCAAIFFACTLALAFWAHGGGKPQGGGDSVLDRPAQTAPSSIVPSALPGGLPASGAAAPAAAASVVPAASAAVPASGPASAASGS